MKTKFTLVFCLLPFLAFSLVYLQDFGPSNNTVLPGGWSKTPSNAGVTLNTASASTSGGANLRMENRIGTSGAGAVEVMVTGVISTIGVTGVFITFEHRRTGSMPAIVLEYSPDGGTNWSGVPGFSTTANSTWISVSYPLPVDAENVNDLAFRWTYSATGGVDFSANYRVDDFRVNNAAALPVELVSFKSQVVDNQILLQWRTATELDNDYFEIEHSANGYDFKTVGKVAGAGTALTPQEYTFLHRNPVSGDNYYRLRQVDFDGSFEYSPIEAAWMESENVWKLARTIASDFIHLNFGNTETTAGFLSIFDLSGKILLSQKLDGTNDVVEIPVHSFPAGQYFLRITDSRHIATQRFQKL